MFSADSWADAFFRSALCSAPRRGTEAVEEALAFLKAFCRAARMIPGDLSGSSDAGRFGNCIGGAMKRCGIDSSEAETARRFTVLLIRKNRFHENQRICAAVEQKINAARGRVLAVLESAFDVTPELEKIVAEAAKRLSGAADVQFETRVESGLIGGVRLRLGSRMYDASIRTALWKMKNDLSGMEAEA